MLIAVAIQTAAQNIGMFIGARALIGFGLGIAATSAPLLCVQNPYNGIPVESQNDGSMIFFRITELAFPSHRAPITSLYNTTWYLGSIVAAWATFGTFSMTSSWSWRIPSVLQGLPSLIQCCLIFFIPESPRWLGELMRGHVMPFGLTMFIVDKGRDAEAIAVLTKYHCGGDENDPLIAYEYEEIKAALALEAEAAHTTWASLFKSRGNLKVR